MAQPNPKAGRMACEVKGCGELVWVRRTGAGKLAYRCEACGSGHFAEPGDKAHRAWVKTMTPHVDDEDEPPAPPANKKPATKPEKLPFGLDQL